MNAPSLDPGQSSALEDVQGHADLQSAAVPTKPVAWLNSSTKFATDFQVEEYSCYGNGAAKSTWLIYPFLSRDRGHGW